MFEYFKPHFLLHVMVDNVHANIYINTSLGVFLKKQIGKRIVVVGVWKISASDYLMLKKNIQTIC